MRGFRKDSVRDFLACTRGVPYVVSKLPTMNIIHGGLIRWVWGRAEKPTTRLDELPLCVGILVEPVDHVALIGVSFRSHGSPVIELLPPPPPQSAGIRGMPLPGRSMRPSREQLNNFSPVSDRSLVRSDISRNTNCRAPQPYSNRKAAHL